MQLLPRGKKNKIKKKLLKYADQDDEDKKSIMTMIGAIEMQVTTKKKNTLEADPYYKEVVKGMQIYFMV
jgi:argonaute-like protein implicated in RNA metabolism and viral defense